MATFAYDFDNTIDAHAYELSQIATALASNGHRNLVVTGRKSDSGIADFLRENGFPEMEIVTKAKDKSTTRAFKARVLREVGADLMFDDDLELPAGHPTKVATFKQNNIRFGYYKR